MKKHVALCAIVLGVATSAWGYHITGVSIAPADPDSSEEVSVTISGWKPASNYVLDRTVLRITGTFVMLDMYWHSEGIGAQVVTPYETTKYLGKLDAGTYTVLVKSWLSGRFCESTSKMFTVTAPASSSPGSTCSCGWWCLRFWPWWGCLRCGCGGSSTSNSSSFASTTGPGTATAFSFSSASTPNSSSSASSLSQSIGR